MSWLLTQTLSWSVHQTDKLTHTITWTTRSIVHSTLWSSSENTNSHFSTAVSHMKCFHVVWSTWIMCICDCVKHCFRKHKTDQYSWTISTYANGTAMTMRLNNSNCMLMLYLCTAGTGSWQGQVTRRECILGTKRGFTSNLVQPYQHLIQQCSIPRPALQDPSMSAWRALYQSKQDQALITLTGLDFETFDWLADKFATYYLRSIPLVQFDFLVEEILAFHRNVIRFV